MVPMRAFPTPGSIKKQKPAARSVQAICGKVAKRRILRPTSNIRASVSNNVSQKMKTQYGHVSIINKAGIANKKFTAPKPTDAKSASLFEYPAWENTDDE